MDRLICGDVGFGKTEVAIRAAFKAVMDGKQVAVLAPTTVLRAAAFRYLPPTDARLSRAHRDAQSLPFAGGTAQDPASFCAKAASISSIGTHRLISGDVIFKDLGLVVIDEEQRFGVLHKEKFKELFKLVDV